VPSYKEICRAMVAVETVRGEACPHIRVDYRKGGSSLKTKNSERVSITDPRKASTSS
jgi:hypothetical protein